MTRRLTLYTIVAALLTVVMAVPALAGNPHFVGQPSTSIEGNTLTVSGKLAGLGNEAQVDIQITVDAACVNPGSKKPQAANKQSFAAAGTFPVQNGKADYSLSVTATFQPSCSPPMTVEWTNLVVTDITHDISQTVAGPL